MPKSSLQAITCKAAVCWGGGEPLKMEEIQVEAPRFSEVRVKMLCASICHTDVLRWEGYPIALFPRVLGHEGVGIVESVGEGVTKLKEGDLVIPTYIGECQECQNCSSEETNFCQTYPLLRHGLMPDHTSRMSVNGQRLYHSFTCSTWSEYTVINANYVVKIDSRITLPHASLISCGFSTGFGATWKETKVKKGSSVAVFGLGGVGLGVVEGARMQGASKIIGVDLNEKKREKGKVFGMTDFINPGKSDKSISQAIKEITDGVGVDYSFGCTGVASLINEALESMVPGRGITTVFGIGQQISVPVSLIALISGRTLKGSVFGGIKPHSDLPAIAKKCINKVFLSSSVKTPGLEVVNNHLNQVKETRSSSFPDDSRGLPLKCKENDHTNIVIQPSSIWTARVIGSPPTALCPQDLLLLSWAQSTIEEFHLDALITQEVQLDEINQAFELLKQPDCLKVMIQINKSLNG